MFELVAITKRNRYVATFPEGTDEGQAALWLLSRFPRAKVAKGPLVDPREPWVRAKENGQ